MMPYGTDYSCEHGEPPDQCTAEGCQHNPDTAYLADLDEQQEAKRRAAEHDQAVGEIAERMRLRQEAEQRLRADNRPAIPAAYTLADLLALQVPEVRYRIAEIWPAGTRVMLAAQAKAGKTTLRDNLARSLVDGHPFLDRFTVQPGPGRVGIVDTELDTAMLQRWLRDQCIEHEDRLWIQPLRGYVASFDLLDDQCREDWAQRLRAAGVRILILDCLGPVLAARGLDESSNPDTGRWLLAFEQLLAAADIGEAVLVHHFGHNGERGRGASRLQDWPDVLWRLVRAEPKAGEPADPLRYFSAAGRDVDVPEGALSYDPMARHLSLTGGGRRAAQLGRDVDAVVEYVAEHPDLCMSEIQDGLAEEIARDRCRAAVKRATRDGKLCEHKAGRNRNNYRQHSQCAEHAETRDSASAHSQGALPL